MYATKIMEIETKEVVNVVYNNYEEYEQHATKLYDKGYVQTYYCCAGINKNICASYERKDRKEIIPRIYVNEV